MRVDVPSPASPGLTARGPRVVRACLALFFGLFACVVLSAQGGAPREDLPPGGSPPDVDPAGAGVVTAEAEDSNLVTSVPIYVQLMQDPIRIAPGETGTILLSVQIAPSNRAASVDQGGRAVFEATQGNLALGSARFDPPAGGAKKYTRGMLVRIPVTVGASSKHGKYPVAGSLELPARNLADADPSKAASAKVENVSWAGEIVCGPAVPRPAVRKRAKPVKAAKPAGGESSSSADVSAPPVRASNAVADVDEITGADEGDGIEMDGVIGVGDSGDPTGIPSWVFLVIAGAGAVLLLGALVRKS